MTLEQQLKDWRELKQMCSTVNEIRNKDIRKGVKTKLYEGVKKYYETYKTKFDYSNAPK